MDAMLCLASLTESTIVDHAERCTVKNTRRKRLSCQASRTRLREYATRARSSMLAVRSTTYGAMWPCSSPARAPCKERSGDSSLRRSQALSAYALDVENYIGAAASGCTGVRILQYRCRGPE